MALPASRVGVARSEVLPNGKLKVQAGSSIEPVLSLSYNTDGDPIINLEYETDEGTKNSPVYFSKDDFDIVSNHLVSKVASSGGVGIKNPRDGLFIPASMIPIITNIDLDGNGNIIEGSAKMAVLELDRFPIFAFHASDVAGYTIPTGARYSFVDKLDVGTTTLFSGTFRSTAIANNLDSVGANAKYLLIKGNATIPCGDVRIWYSNPF